MTDHRSLVAVTLTCLVAAMSYAGAVTTLALGAFVLPGVALGAAVAMGFVAQRRWGASVIVGALASLGWAEAVNVLSGDYNGPAARSTFVASGLTSLAVVLASSPWPSTFLASVGGVVFGALALGAGGEVRVVAVATAVVALLGLASIERSRRRWGVSPPRRPVTAVIALLVAGVAGVVILLQAQHDPRPGRVLAPSVVDSKVRPPWHDPFGMTAKTRHIKQQATPVKSRAQKTTRTLSKSRVWTNVELSLLGLVVLVAVALLLWRVRAVVAWRRLRRRLRRGSDEAAVTGAWVWIHLRLMAARMPLPAALSPDLVGARAVRQDVPVTVADDIACLAKVVTRVAFMPGNTVADGDVAAAWSAADNAAQASRRALTRWGRLRLALCHPPRSSGRLQGAVRRKVLA